VHAGGGRQARAPLNLLFSAAVTLFQAFDYHSSDFKALLRRFEGSVKALLRFYSGLTKLTYFSAQPLRFFEAFDYQSSDFKALLRRYEGSIKALLRFY